MAQPTVVYGGSFDPITDAHVLVVKHLLERFNTVAIAATTQNPWKDRKPTPLAARNEMIRQRLRFEGIPIVSEPWKRGVYISRIRYVLAREFVEKWRRRYKTEIRWGLGADIQAEYPKWSDGWMAKHIHPVIIPEMPGPHATDIREGRAQPHPSILPVIRKHKLYGFGDVA